MTFDTLKVHKVPGTTTRVLLLLSAICLPQLAMGNTYPVTSTQCTGPGSIVDAMDLANANPGTDTISIAAGLTIDAGTCPHPPGRFDDVNFVILEARESTVIEGNGATIRGHIGWVTLEGIITPLTACPSARRGDWITSLTPGLINVGQEDQDNSAITVTRWCLSSGGKA